MHFTGDFDLTTYNTFGIFAKASRFFRAGSEKNIEHLYSQGLIQSDDLLVLGGGSNILFAKDPPGPVFLIDIQGFQITESPDGWLVSAGAGMIWDDFVAATITEGLNGLENLSYIPGSVGASPVQNIGAYGVEMADCFHSLTAFDRLSGEWVKFSKKECEFDYRSSVFKTRMRGRFIITQVCFQLQKDGRVNASYGNIEQELLSSGISDPHPADVRDAVIAIRRSKLPDPSEIGNAGSFFKNPILEAKAFEPILMKYPSIPYYSQAAGRVKLAAGWLIDQCGLKAYRHGDAGVHKDQALVLVNYANASGQEMLRLAEYVRDTVFDKFGVVLQPEVNIIGDEMK